MNWQNVTNPSPLRWGVEMSLLKLSDSNHYIFTFHYHSDEMGLGKTLQCITTLWYVL